MKKLLLTLTAGLVLAACGGSLPQQAGLSARLEQTRTSEPNPAIRKPGYDAPPQSAKVKGLTSNTTAPSLLLGRTVNPGFKLSASSNPNANVSRLVNMLELTPNLWVKYKQKSGYAVALRNCSFVPQEHEAVFVLPGYGVAELGQQAKSCQLRSSQALVQVHYFVEEVQNGSAHTRKSSKDAGKDSNEVTMAVLWSAPQASQATKLRARLASPEKACRELSGRGLVYFSQQQGANVATLVTDTATCQLELVEGQRGATWSQVQAKPFAPVSKLNF